MTVPTCKKLRPLLLCSLGNPGSTYAFTRHNAGHVMLDLYHAALRFPTFKTESGLKGMLAHHGSITLFRSGSFMNDSGSAVAKAYRDFKRIEPDGVLCVVHDEMESTLGTIKVRRAGKGKGHNGIRSCIKMLGTEEFARMAIGISRPESRESAIVTNWVLGRFSSNESKVLQDQSLLKMINHVEQLQLT